MRPDRRGLLRAGAVAGGALLLSGCDRLSNAPWFLDAIGSAEQMTQRLQRLLIGNALAPEFAEADISPQFKANGSTDPQDDDYRKLARRGFARWKLAVGGLVERPMEFSLADLRALPARTQITRHDCVEGWSCIGKWKGVALGQILQQVELKPAAKFIVFHCADSMDDDADEDDESDENKTSATADAPAETPAAPGPAAEPEEDVKYYESVDLRDAFHPQTILAYEMNDRRLTVPHGAPLRLRVERQLGYKMAKYIMRIEAVESFAHLGKGKGGYWEDRGYEWYAGI